MNGAISRDRQSPNFGERLLPISLIILHYTGMESAEAAIDRLCDPEAAVSAHYVVREDGQVLQMVDEQHRAWHAGKSGWRGISDVNSASIGIEIVNGGHDYGLPDFPDRQIDSVIALCRDIQQRHNIPSENYIGHSDIAPGRKSDPGEKFPWAMLAENGLGLWAEPRQMDRRVLFVEGDRDRGVALMQRGLAQIGYDISVSGQYDRRTHDVVEAFQRHFRPLCVTGQCDMETMDLISQLAEK